MNSNSKQKQRDKQARDPLRGKLFKNQLNSQTNTSVSQGHLELSNVDFVSSNANSSHKGAMLHIFEDNEDVIKMIIKGRSPTLRHVSRTHRVAIDWLFDRINLDPKIQVKYADSKNQLADILSKGNFTRDEWNTLLCLFNISLFQSSKLLSSHVEEAAKSRPVRNLVSRSRAGISTVTLSTASASSGNVGSESHDLDLEASTAKPVDIYQKTGAKVTECGILKRGTQMQNRWQAGGEHGTRTRCIILQQVPGQPGRRFGGTKRVQSSFCRISLIQRKSEYEIADDVESSSKEQNERQR